jgi:translation initiation factor IF-2
MADAKIRIFSLAKELEMDSKVLIEHCRSAGVTVKGSALASISPEEKTLVMSHINGTAAPVAEPEDVRAPTRTLQPAGGGSDSLRDLRGMQPRQRVPETTPEPKPEPVQQEAAPVEVVAETVVADKPEAEGTEAVSPAAEAPETEVAQETAAEPVAADAAAAEPVPATETAEAPAESSEPAEKSDEKEDSSLKREDYVSLHGNQSVREMKSRSMTAVGRKGSQKSKPQLPALAEMPAFAPQKPKKEEKGEKAQQPVIKLTPEQIAGQSPLAIHLQRSSEEKKTTKGGPKKNVQFTNQDPRDKSRGVSLDASRTQRRNKRHRKVRDEHDSFNRRGIRRKKRSGPVELKTNAILELPITVRSLSESIGRPAKSIITILFKKGLMVTINQALEEEEAWEIAAELGVELEIKREQTTDEILNALLEQDDDEDTLTLRPPVVTILGHVDHGKTSLLDKIRATDVVAGEAGGITQHIRAYQVDHQGQKVTFVDTPGHAAFGEMRARGANVTDIIVLVVAANDSVMPQTIECISHAKASGAPVIVAMNKMDLPDINEQRILGDLSTNGIQPQEWGGDVEIVRTSAETGLGIDDLLETILLTAEVGELKANIERNALGVCLEAFQDEGIGPIAWIIVQKGILRIGDVVQIGQTFGRIRQMYNDKGETLSEAPPSMPVKVTGLNAVPGAGDHFFVMDDVEEARGIAEERIHAGRTKLLSNRGGPRSFEDILREAREGKVQDLNIILKGDTPGSIEAIKGELSKLDHPEVRVKVLHEAVGGVNESDVYLASASDAVIVAFHVIAEDRAQLLADNERVEIRRYNIIYKVTDEIRGMLEGMLEPEEKQVATGRAVVLQTFSVSKTGTIAGCRVLSGKIERSNRIHVIRDQKLLNDYPIASLRRVKDDVKDVREGMECGIRLDGFNDVKEGDLLEAFRIESVKRTLE